MDEIKQFIIDNIEKYMFKGAVVGISGGIDSCVVGKLLADSLGRDKVFALILPERDTSSNTVDDAIFVCEYIGIDYEIIEITKIIRSMGVYSLKPPAFPFPKAIQNIYSKNIWKSQENAFIQDLTTQGDKKFSEALAYYRAKPRVRSNMLYFEAEKRGYAVAGCTNKTEALIGFYTKWGDESCDIEPIRHLYKTEVYKIAEELNVPPRIIDKLPSPDIAPGITDEFALGINYDELDRILMKIENNKDLSSENEDSVKKVMEMIENRKFREMKQLHL